MKKYLLFLTAIFLISSALPTNSSDIFIGTCVYKFNDTHLTEIRKSMQEEIRLQGGEIVFSDGESSQPLQQDQIDGYITKGVDALIIVPIGSTAEYSIEKAKPEDIPVVIVNREPDPEILKTYDKVWYVGSHAEDSGIQSGQILVDYFKSHPEADKNRDGKIQYIMLCGELGHQDTTIRTEYSVKALKDAGFELEELGREVADWEKVKGFDKMKGFISSFGVENIEAVIANNDDMALGAIEALKAEGYNLGDDSKFIPVVGVDATAPALESMEKGELLGTVLNDAYNQGVAAVRIAMNAADGKEINKETIGYEVTDGKYIWIPYRKVTVENLKKFILNKDLMLKPREVF